MDDPTIAPGSPPNPGPRATRTRFAGVALLIALGVGAALDARSGWVATAFEAAAHEFYEVPRLAAIRRPSQVPLVRMHLAIAGVLAAVGLIGGPSLGRHGGRWWGVFVVGCLIRATCWIAGGNLPMVSGDSPHYVEVAGSILRGEGPVKHYVESFFVDYPAIRRGEGVLDDWATPLYPYVLAGAYKLAGVVPGESLEATVAIDKGVSFALNLLALPAIYLVGRRRYGPAVGLGGMALLAILPAHAIYAGLDLRESLVCLLTILAVGAVGEVSAGGKRAWAWGIAAGLFGGLAILARDAAMATLAAVAVETLLFRRKTIGPMLLAGVVAGVTVAPWAIATYRAYGSPFYTYTRFFQYTFSWTVHHYQEGVPRAADFYSRANAPEILRVKLKAALIIAGYSTMILGLPLVLAIGRRVLGRERGPYDRLVATIGLVFVVATLARVADVTQVAQLGRYYLPVFALMMPVAAAGLGDGWRRWNLPDRARPALALGLVALLWADPTWAYDASWTTKPYQLHWPALREAGDWVKAHPEAVPPGARVMAWFPWEFRLASGRTTVLMPRNFSASRIREVIEQYGVTHVLWGSFETPAEADPEAFGPYLSEVRTAVGLGDSREIHRSPRSLPFGVRLYRLRGAIP